MGMADMEEPMNASSGSGPHLLGATELWIEETGNVPESNVLITISDTSGEHTYLMAGQKIIETKSSLFVQAPEERIVVGPRIWYTRMNNAFRWSGYALAIVLMTFSVLSFSGTVKARVVLTSSMVPTINPGDIILTTPAKNVSPKVGSIVAYVGRRFDGTAVGVFSHRIVGGDAASGFIVKGDHNPTPDTQRPKIPDITGVVIFVIPIIGRFLTPKALMITVPLVFGLWLIFDALKND
ncbi:MAG: signal peptidase I [Actinobacteria bacterium]|nr:signal peptidase I [Actinomycetota bacterium]